MDKDVLIHHIAVVLDKPSIYMGGPSMKSRRQATKILEQLDYLGYQIQEPNRG